MPNSLIKYILILFLLSNYIFAKPNTKSNNISYLMLSYVNAIRAKGAKCSPPTSPLKLNSSLQNAAKIHVADMAINNFLAHNGSGTMYDVVGYQKGKKSSFFERLKYYGFPFIVGNLIGENVSKVSIKKTKSTDIMSNFKAAVKNWLDDPPHCKIFMDPRFTDVGLSYHKAGKYYYFVMDLGEIR